MNEQLLHTIALTKLPGIGNITAKKLIYKCGGPEGVFRERKRALEKVSGVGIINSSRIMANKKEALEIAEKELEFVQDQNIQTLYFQDKDYPFRLAECGDGPILLFTKGNIKFNTRKAVSIVGTRKASNYGLGICKELVADLKRHNPLIISGLAYGIDKTAHEQAVAEGLQTVGVLAHGLDRIYPASHRRLAAEMWSKGGVASEFTSGTIPERENFPKRNRIVAGLADITIVVESRKKGGSLITARLALDYNREVGAFPGSVGLPQSEGCNKLIKSSGAALIEGVKDVERLLSWKGNKENTRKELKIPLSKNQENLAQLLIKKGRTEFDQLVREAKLSPNEISALLLELEFLGVVQSYPGKLYGVV